MIHAYAIWKANNGNDFTLEHAWQLLKNQPKWLDQAKETSSKRAKISANGDYSPLSNLETPIEVSETNTTSWIPRLMGQKTTNRKIKGKGGATSSLIVDLSSMKAAIKEKIVATKNIMVSYTILMNDTSTCLKNNVRTTKSLVVVFF